MSVLPSPPPMAIRALSGLILAHQALKLAQPGLNLALKTANLPSRSQIGPPRVKSALQASNQLTRHQISSLGLKSALQTSSLPQRPQICFSDLKSAFQTSNLPLITSVFLGLIYSPSGRLEIHPCVLQDIGPLGPLPCSLSTSLDHSKQGIGYR